MVQETADLHFHSTHSDGSHSVDWVSRHLSQQHDQGLRLAVLTDHDGFAGYSEFVEATKSWQPVICGTELSCTFSLKGITKELHLLVYGLTPEEPELLSWVKRFRSERETRFYRMCEKLSAAGYPLDANKIASRHSGVLGRPHIADALVEIGVARDRPDAFDRFLKAGAPYYVEKWRFPLEDAVRYAEKWGCKTSIAHPGQYGLKREVLGSFKEMGVDAIEVFHPRHSAEDESFYLDLARSLDFSISGGSDFHSESCDQIEGRASLGRTRYPFEEAKRFLGDLL